MGTTVPSVAVLDKAVTVLDALAAAPRALALGELVAATGLPRATAHRIAVALERHGLVRRDGEGRFGLGLRLAGLGRAATSAYPLAEAARPVLVQLREETGESVQLFVRSGDGRLCVESLESPHSLRWIVPVGQVLPLDRGSAGRVLSGFGPLVESVEEREPGAASVSAAVCDGGGEVIAAVSVSGPVERLSRSPSRRYGKAVATAARSIEAAIG